MINILASYLIFIPAAILCYLPVKGNLKHSLGRTLAVLVPVFLAMVALTAFLTLQFGLMENDLIIPLLLICFLAYHFSLSLPLVKTLGVYSAIVALMSVLSNYAACIDAARNQDSGLGSYTLTFSLSQFAVAVVTVLLLAYPFMKYGKNVIDRPVSSNIWKAVIVCSAIVIVVNIAILPVEYYFIHDNNSSVSSVNILLILSAQLVIWFLMLIILCFAISSSVSMSKTLEKNRILEMQESQFRSQQKYLKDFERTRHDFRHSILTLAELYNEGKNKELGKYLNQYIKAMPKKEIISFCDNTALNAQLNYYVHIAKQNKIDLKLRVDIPDEIPVSDVDLCSVVGNVLENAVSACQYADEKSIQLTIVVEDEAQLYIVAVNTFDGIVCQNGETYLSTKPEGKGIGLSSVKETAESYGGSAQFSHEGKLFFTNIAIPLNYAVSIGEEKIYL